MKFSSTLKSSLEQCTKLVAERNRLIELDGELDKLADAAEANREAARGHLGDAQLENQNVDRAQAAFRDAELVLEGLVAAKRSATTKLVALAQAAKEPLEALHRETDGFRDEAFAELQADLTHAAEALAIVVRRVMAVADGLGVPVVPVGGLNELPGVTASVPLSLDWRNDPQAVKARESVSGLIETIRGLERLQTEAAHRAMLARGRARPDFSLLFDQRSFVVLDEELKFSGKVYKRGDTLRRDACHIDLLRQLYEQRKVGVRDPAAVVQ